MKILIFLAITLLSYTVFGSETQPTTIKQLSAKETVASFHQAIRNANAKRARSLLDEHVVIFEGNGVERSADEYANHHMKSDMKFMSKMTVKMIEHNVHEVGNMAYSASRSSVKGNYNEGEINFNSVETMILTRADEKGSSWKIVHIHWSN